ncbi:GM11086 [Drosophila sechellia]|uniref:GM11086 n=1 Tax=Drosophila sechellia TaxID=7238 RepID=B4HX41_DROSE|nr:GM11086 [Drosophila sechellia]
MAPKFKKLNGLGRRAEAQSQSLGKARSQWQTAAVGRITIPTSMDKRHGLEMARSWGLGAGSVRCSLRYFVAIICTSLCLQATNLILFKVPMRDRWSMELEMEQDLEMELELEVKVTKPECQSGVPDKTHAKVSQPDAA